MPEERIAARRVVEHRAQAKYRETHDRIKIMVGGVYVFDRVFPKGIGRSIRDRADAFREAQRAESPV